MCNQLSVVSEMNIPASHNEQVCDMLKKSFLQWTWLFFLLLILPLGCVVSPQPEPPLVNAKRISASLIETNPENPNTDHVRIVGQSGAVSPGGSRLVIINLLDASAWADLTTAPDGSFDTTIPGIPGDELRLQAFFGERYSTPVSLIVPERDGGFESTNRPLEDCFTINPETNVDLGQLGIDEGSFAVVDLRNSCSEDVLIDEFYLLKWDYGDQLCDDEHLTCQAGSTPVTQSCSDQRSTCENNCESSYQNCIGDGTPEETCRQDYGQCFARCEQDDFDCVFVACQDQLFDCQDGSLFDGFFLDSELFPFSISPGSTRPIVVDFVSAEEGLYEELLILRISTESSLTSEYRTVLMTASI